MQIKLKSCLPYLVDLFINKLKTKFNNLFHRMILNNKRIHNFEGICLALAGKFLFLC